jgi:hypothetical protein
MSIPDKGYPAHDSNGYRKNKLPKGLMTKLAFVIFEEGYLCYHDDDGCHYVLREIIDILHDYEINEKKNDHDTPKDQKTS